MRKHILFEGMGRSKQMDLLKYAPSKSRINLSVHEASSVFAECYVDSQWSNASQDREDKSDNVGAQADLNQSWVHIIRSYADTPANKFQSLWKHA